MNQPGTPPWSAGRSVDVDLDDLEPERAAGDGDLGDLADLLADQALSDRAGQEDLVLVVVFLAGADEDEVFLVVELEVEDADPRAEDDPIGGEGGAVDDHGAGELVLEF